MKKNLKNLITFAVTLTVALMVTSCDFGSYEQEPTNNTIYEKEIEFSVNGNVDLDGDGIADVGLPGGDVDVVINKTCSGTDDEDAQEMCLEHYQAALKGTGDCDFIIADDPEICFDGNLDCADETYSACAPCIHPAGNGIPAPPEVFDGVDNDCDGLLADGECASDADCPEGLVCDELSHMCVGCLDDSDCADNDVCNGVESCVDMICQAGTPLECDDGAFCNGTESCDPATGCVLGTPPIVDDGVDCTADSCDEENDVVVNATDDSFCDDSDMCTGTETCDAIDGCLPGTPLECDDGNDCTSDSCDPLAGCSNEVIAGCAATCDPANDLGEDGEAGGDCAPYRDPELGDEYGWGCDDGTCVAYEDQDGDEWADGTESFCSDGIDGDLDGTIDCDDADCDDDPACADCLADEDCEDGNVCTTDSCVDGVCVQGFNNNPCDDGDVCTTDDECKDGGVCMGGPALDCDDGDPCTLDSCDPLTGCVHEFIPECGNACEGVVCNVGEHCEGGLCVADGYAVWCWDNTLLPEEEVPHCHTFTGDAGTYWSPDIWLFGEYSELQPECGSAPAGVNPPPVEYPAPICCVSDADGLGPCVGGATFNPYQ